MQILEDGRLTDSKGRTVDFKNTLIIMTSNVGSSVIEKGGGGLGFQLNEDAEASSYNRIKTLVNEELKQYFRPEFLNRLDEIIVFRQLTKLEVKQIADIMLNEVRCPPPPSPSSVRLMQWSEIPKCFNSEQAGMMLPIDTRNPPSGDAEYFLSATRTDPPARPPYDTARAIKPTVF